LRDYVDQEQDVKPCFCLLSIVLLTSADAQALSGTDLYKICNAEPKGGTESISCIAYIRGLVDGLFMADHMASSGLRYCPPESLSADQAVLIVQKHFREHPEQLNREAGAVAALALYGAFDCKNSN